MRRSILFSISLLILAALLAGIVPVTAQETDLRLIAIREKTLEDPTFEVRIKNATATDIDWNGARSNPRRVIVAAVLDSSEYGTAAVFAGSEKLVVIAVNLGPQGDGVVIQDYQPPTTIGGPKIVETCYLLAGSTGGDIIPQAQADDALIGALTLVTMKQEVTQEEQDEAVALLERYFDIPRNPSVTPSSNQNTISWTTSKLVTEYNIYWSLTAGVTIETGTKIENVTTPHAHTGLTNGTTYHYVVTAVRISGLPGGLSKEVESIIDPVNLPDQEVSGTPPV